MADENKKKSLGVEPSIGWWDKLFGPSTIPDNVRKAIEIAKKENPNLAPVEQYGPLSNLMMGDNPGYTSPMGTIYVNPAQHGGPRANPEEIADTLIHEQKHVNQLGQSMLPTPMAYLKGALSSILTPYHERDYEQEAYEAQKNRAFSQGRSTAISDPRTGEMMYVTPERSKDIELRNPKHPVTPSESNEERLARLMREPRIKNRRY